MEPVLSRSVARIAAAATQQGPARFRAASMLTALEPSLPFCAPPPCPPPHVSHLPSPSPRPPPPPNPPQIGKVKVGSEHPIALQTMTTTDTRNVAATVEQVRAWWGGKGVL